MKDYKATQSLSETLQFIGMCFLVLSGIAAIFTFAISLSNEKINFPLIGIAAGCVLSGLLLKGFGAVITLLIDISNNTSKKEL